MTSLYGSTGNSHSVKAGPFRTLECECASSVILFRSTDGLRDSFLTSISQRTSSSDSTTLVTDLEIACASKVCLFHWAGVFRDSHSTSLCMRTSSSNPIQSSTANAILAQDLCVVGPLLGDARFLRTIQFDHGIFDYWARGALSWSVVSAGSRRLERQRLSA